MSKEQILVLRAVMSLVALLAQIVNLGVVLYTQKRLTKMS